MSAGISIGWLLLALALIFVALGWCGLALFHGAPNLGTSAWSSLRQRVGRLPTPTFPVFSMAAAGFFLRRHRWVLAGCVIAALAVGMTLSLSERNQLDPLHALQWAHADEISLRLNEEKLAPPAPLPPTLFAGTERSGLETADRDWGKLDQDFMQLVLYLLTRMEARGYPMALLEGYRSPEQQTKLAAQGAHVTQARAWESKHQFGLAVDLAPIKNGALMISERDPWALEAYQILGEEARSIGLNWGGRWSMKDYGHIEAAGTIAANTARPTALVR